MHLISTIASNNSTIRHSFVHDLSLSLDLEQQKVGIRGKYFGHKVQGIEFLCNQLSLFQGCSDILFQRRYGIHSIDCNFTGQIVDVVRRLDIVHELNDIR